MNIEKYKPGGFDNYDSRYRDGFLAGASAARFSGVIDFNINHYVYVKLTDVGKKEHRRQYDELWKGQPALYSYRPPEEDAEGWSKWQMHDLMFTFGHLCIGFSNVPFETTIRIETESN